MSPEPQGYLRKSQAEPTYRQSSFVKKQHTQLLPFFSSHPPSLPFCTSNIYKLLGHKFWEVCEKWGLAMAGQRYNRRCYNWLETSFQSQWQICKKRLFLILHRKHSKASKIFHKKKCNREDFDAQNYRKLQFPISRSLSTSRRRTDELGYRLERPIHFECKLNEPMHIGMRLLHPAAADHSVSINRQQVQRIFSFSLRSRAVFIVLLQTYLWECLKTLVLADGDSAVVVSFVEWIAHIRLHYPLLCCSDHLPCALQHAKRAKHFSKRVLRAERLF